MKEPAYLSLYRSYVNEIVTGVYPYGSKLPSKRDIAAKAGVSVITAAHALTLLSDEGYVETRERSGCFVIYRRDDFPVAVPAVSFSPEVEKEGIHKSTESLISYSIVAKTMRRILQDYGEEILVKSPNRGSRVLREEISAYLMRSRGIRVQPSRIVIGSGAEYLYGLVVQFLGTKEIYAIEDPSYDKICSVYRVMGAAVEKLKLGRNGILSEELTRTKARILHVTPFHSFPSGITADISKKNEYIRWAAERDGILIEDNYDSELTVSKKMEESLFSMAPDTRVLYINTFSKTIAPSLRLGYMILPASMEEAFQEKLGFISCTVPVFDQLVVAELIRNGDFERHINRVRRKKRLSDG